MPVQRLPRYSLLFSNMLQYTQEGTTQYVELKTAIELLEKKITAINEGKKVSDR